MRTFGVLTAALVAALTLSAQAPDFTPPTPLFGAILQGNTQAVKQTLEQGANPNEGKFLGFAPLFFPIIANNPEIFRALVAKGADVQAKDAVGSTTLMWAAFNENGDPTLVEELLKLGVNPNTKNQKGETALTWALRRGDTPIVAALRKGGASDAGQIRDSIEKAIALLQKSGPEFFKVSGCTSCHNQALPQMTNAVARERGFAVNEQIAQQQVKTVLATYRPQREEMLRGGVKIPDPPINVSYALAGLAAENYPADDTTDAMAQLIASRQLPDGSFRALPARPPLESSDFTATAMSVRALLSYGKSPQPAVAKAAAWLEVQEPHSNEDRVMKILGLIWAKSRPELIGKEARVLLSEQRQDGGWGQLPALETDAYATGQALVALKLSGQSQVSDPAYQRGVGYLLRTQLEDGSWLVRTRAFPFQPYKESGFPHGKHQWISAAGSSWAAMALSFTAPTAKTELSKAF